MLAAREDSDSLGRNARESGGRNRALSRRDLLKSAAGAMLAAAGASLSGAIGALAQESGLYTSNLPPELPLPMGALTYLDRKQYIHNMEIVSHLSGSTISGGEPLMAMWAKGKQRLLPAGGGFVDISNAKNPAVLNKGVIKGPGDSARKWRAPRGRTVRAVRRDRPDGRAGF